MGLKKAPFHRRYTKATSSGTNTLRGVVVRPGCLVCYQRYGVINETTAYTRLRFWIKGTTADFLIDEQGAPLANQFYWDDKPIYLTESQYLEAELIGCTADDVIVGYYTGWEMEGLEGG